MDDKAERPKKAAISKPPAAQPPESASKPNSTPSTTNPPPIPKAVPIKPQRLFLTYKGDTPQNNAILLRNYVDLIEKGIKHHELLAREDIPRLETIAKNHLPTSVREALDVLQIVVLNKRSVRNALKTLNVKTLSELRIAVGREVIATKMVQRQLCLATIIDCADDFDIKNPSLANEQHHRLRRLPASVVRGPYKRKGAPDRIHWISGDMPVYDERERVVPAMPPLEKVLAHISSQQQQEQDTANVSAAEPQQAEQPPVDPIDRAADETHDENSEESEDSPEFEDGEYCRLLHALADKSLAPYLNQLLDAQLKEKPWVEHVAPLFNSRKFRPVPIKSVAHGVQLSDIKGLSPRLICERDGETLQQKFAEFRSLYRAAVRSYLEWGNDDTHSFADFSQSKRYITYAFCLLENYPQLEPLTLKAAETQKEVEPTAKPTSATASAKRGIASIDVDGDEEMGDLHPSPTAKRAKAAMLGDRERDELLKIIGGDIPEEIRNASGDQTGFTVPLTKSEEIRMKEREEKDKAMFDAIAKSGGLGSEGLMWSLLRLAPSSGKFREIEDKLIEKVATEAEEAQDRYIITLLNGLRDARSMMAEAQTSEEKAVFKRVSDTMYSTLRERIRRRSQS